MEAVADLKQRMGIEASRDNLAIELVTEAGVSKRLRLDAAKAGVMLWRNNVGAYFDDNGNFIRYGLANDSAAMNKRVKSSDLIGLKPNGQFICREVKAPGWQYSGTAREKAQLQFIELVLAKGGDAEFSTGQLDIDPPVNTN